jgi:hypothetical protein
MFNSGNDSTRRLGSCDPPREDGKEAALKSYGRNVGKQADAF